MNSETHLHWAEEKEVIHSNKPVKLLIKLIAHLPNFIVNILIFPVGFFYFVFSKRARNECSRYQNQFIEYTKNFKNFNASADSSTNTSTNNKSEQNREVVKISVMRPLRQIISFSLCILEKIEGWSKKIPLEHISFYEEVEKLIEHLESGKGAFLIGSHLGNTELLRSLAAIRKTGVDREIEVTVIMENAATQNFSKTIQDMFPDSKMNVIDAANIGAETIIFLEEQLEKGGMIVA
ncbi:MAG: hypothetical protein IJR49_02240, partial [Treponema sp.]|nr:hypothetical protein [Treponema sp.]